MEMAEGQKKMTEDDVRAEVNTFMFEGHDTTSSGILWTLYELGRNPDIQEKAYEEICSIFKDSNRLPTKEDLTEMKYLESIIKEGLRLYPSVPMISRNLKEDVKIRKRKIKFYNFIKFWDLLIKANSYFCRGLCNTGWSKFFYIPILCTQES